MEIEKLLTVLNRINWNYGKGDIHSLTINLVPSITDFRGTVQRNFPYCGGDTRGWVVNNGKVKFLGRVRKV